MTNYTVKQMIGGKWVHVTAPMPKKYALRVKSDFKKQMPFQKFKIDKVNKRRKK